MKITIDRTLTDDQVADLTFAAAQARTEQDSGEALAPDAYLAQLVDRALAHYADLRTLARKADLVDRLSTLLSMAPETVKDVEAAIAPFERKVADARAAQAVEAAAR